jgi:hypothetical protein
VNIEFALESPNFSDNDELRQTWWPIRPATGILWADILWLLIVGALDTYVLPAVTDNLLPFRLMTPWLIVTFVVARTDLAFIAMLLGSLIIETSTAAPRGLYLTGFWVIYATITLTRKTLSWRHAVPWLVTFFAASFSLANFETAVIFLRQDPAQLDFFHFAKQTIRVTLCVVVGMAMAQSWMYRFKGDSPSP